MGRKLMRVPLDFDWPLNMNWKGYINPYRPQECKACEGSGQNPETKQVADDFYDFARTGRRWCDAITQDEVDALVAKERLWDFWRRVGPNGWEDIDPRPVVTAEMVNAASRSNREAVHDGINRWILVETRAHRLGVYGDCRYCKGEGCIWQSPEVRALHEAWEDFDPPKGDGFQLWQTTSEGAPVSPVFATLDDLCAWCSTGATTFGSARATAAQWRSMLDDGFVARVEGGNVFM